MAQKKVHDMKPVIVPTKTYMAMPRPWFVLLVAIVVLPWFALAAIWLKPASRTDIDSDEDLSVKTTRAGKWGELTLIPIVISPPKELVFTDWGFNPRPTWIFPNMNADSAAQMLQSVGVSAIDAEKLRARAQTDSRIKGVILTPDAAWVRALSPEVRGRIYHMLAGSPLNSDQVQAFRYPGENPGVWLTPKLVSDRTRQLVEPLIYRDGGYMLFSDIELVRPEIGSDRELRQLGKALFQQPTVLARLSVSRSSDLDTLAEYWGRGGRRTEIRPLLESVAEGGPDRFVDVTRLLPPFARDRLYSYPELSAADIDKPDVINCLWTSLNFFLPHPDNRFLDSAVAVNALKENYFIVEADFELGDIVAFLDEEGNLFHAGVYIADDLVFSKNGISAMAPWTLMSIDEVKRYYHWRSDNPRLIFHRRKYS